MVREGEREERGDAFRLKTDPQISAFLSEIERERDIEMQQR